VSTKTGQLHRYHLIAIDQLEFGLSDKPMVAYRISTLSDVLEGFFRSQGIPRAVVIGNSMGGWVADYFTCMHPQLVDKLILLDSAGLSRSALRQEGKSDGPINLSDKEGLRRLAQLAYYGQSYVTDQYVDKLFEARLRTGDGYMLEEIFGPLTRQEDSLDTRIGNIHQPTAIILGAADRLIDPSYALRFRRGIAGSKLTVMSKCGHMPHVECTKRLAPIVTAFLDGPASHH
jgi:pimeloyl-ACP methyl ester carboxylesterase